MSKSALLSGLIILFAIGVTPISAVANLSSSTCSDSGSAQPVPVDILNSLTTTEACALPKLVLSADPIVADVPGLNACVCGILMSADKTARGIFEFGAHPVKSAEGVASFVAHPVRDVHAIESALSANMKNFKSVPPSLKTSLVCDSLTQVILFAVPIAQATKVALVKDAAAIAAASDVAATSGEVAEGVADAGGEVIVDGQRGSIVGEFDNGDLVFKSTRGRISRTWPEDIAKPVTGQPKSVVVSMGKDTSEARTGTVLGVYPDGDLAVKVPVYWDWLNPFDDKFDVIRVKPDAIPKAVDSAQYGPVSVHGLDGTIVGKYKNGSLSFRSNGGSFRRIAPWEVAQPVSGDEAKTVSFAEVQDSDSIRSGTVIGKYPNGDLEIKAPKRPLYNKMEMFSRNRNAGKFDYIRVRAKDLVQPLADGL